MSRDDVRLVLDVVLFALFGLGAACAVGCGYVIWEIKAAPPGVYICGLHHLAVPLYALLAIMFWVAFLVSLAFRIFLRYL
jgi:hypothetical protein